VLAELDADEAKWPESVKHFQRAAKLSESMFRDAVDLFLGYYHHPESAVELAGNDVLQLRFVAAELRALGKDPTTGPTTGPATQPSDEADAMQADVRAEKLIRATADSSSASSKILGEMGLLCFDRQDYSGAVNYLNRALKIEYGRQDWRMAKARALVKLGRKDAAIQEAQTILLSQPGNSDAQNMIDDLNAPTTRSSGFPF
jgi:tetratricopeptide (TPR) repeat protein